MQTFLVALAKVLFQGFDQTKVIEDSSKVLRDRDTRDVCNRVLEFLRQLVVTVDSKGLELHRRAYVPVQVTNQKLFQCISLI